LRNRISAALALACFLTAPVAATAQPPSIATLDADLRASGNRKAVAEHLGDALFAIEWPAQLTKISANAADGSLVVGLRLSGVKFHAPLSRAGFESEAATLIARAFALDPRITEVDLWTAVPLAVGKGVIVTGDLATPTTRNVFTVSVRRGESEAALARRIASGRGVYVDEEWARTILKRGT
jgi:hypothetical protein